MSVGISLYFGSGLEANLAIINKARAAGLHYAFTSLQIPEEEGKNGIQEVRDLLEACRAAKINLIADISPATLERLEITSFEELKRLGFTHVRLDFGFDAAQTVELSRLFNVVFNASTITQNDISAWERAGADFSRFSACHNFYPKRYTGLSLDEFSRINSRLKNWGFTTMAFVPGDLQLRGPLFEGLPTIEEHRGHTGMRLVLDSLELMSHNCDVVLVGDVDVEQTVWERLSQLEAQNLILHAALKPDFEYLYGRVQHDRPDSSDYIVRSQESRLWKEVERPAAFAGSIDDAKAFMWEAAAGTVVVSNTAYGRYAGELSITRRSLLLDGRDTCAGTITKDDQVLLPYITHGMGFTLVRA